MSIQVSYPYDPTGLNDANLIEGERYALSSLDNTFRCIVPQLAPFFRHGLQLVHWPSGKDLTEGKDYYLVSHSNISDEIADLPLYGIIAFINQDLAGEIEIRQYRTIGGKWVDVHKRVFERLANILTDPAEVNWLAVLDELDALPVVDHDQSWSDFTNTNAIAAAIDGITAAMAAKAAGNGTQVLNELEARLVALQDYVAATEFDKHILNSLNPHGIKAVDVSALPLGTKAIDAFKMFGMDLLAFTDYLNSKRFSMEDYRNYLAKNDAAATDFAFRLQDGQAVIGNEDLSATIDLNGMRFSVSMSRSGRMAGDVNRGLAGKTVTLKAGANTLKVVSDGKAYNEDSLLLNDKVVIHVGNIRRIINTYTGGFYYITVSDTATLDLSGDGSTDNPLKAAVLYNSNPQAAASIGMITAVYGNNPGLFAAASLLTQLGQTLTGYVPKTRYVGLHQLNGNVVIDKVDLGLNKVDNTADIDKPVSTDQQQLLDQYSPMSHTHTLDQLGVQYADYDTKGTVYLFSADGFGTGDAVTPSVFKNVTAKLAAWQTALNAVVDADAIPIIALYTELEITSYPETITDPDHVVTTSEQWSFVAGEGQLMCCNGVVYEGVSATFSLWSATTGIPKADSVYYLYAKINNDDTHTFSYQLSDKPLGTTDSRILAAMIKPTATGVTTASYPTMQSFGEVSDITDHIDDTAGHQNVPLPFNDLNIRMVDNKTVVNSLSPFSPWAMINEWRTMFKTADEVSLLTSVDPNELVLTVDTSGMSTNATTWKYGGFCSNVNMWDQLTELDATYMYAKVDLLYQHKATSDTQLDVALRAFSPVIGASVNAQNQVSGIIAAPYGSAADVTPYRTVLPHFKFSDKGTIVDMTIPNSSDPYDVMHGLGDNSGVTPIMHSIYWRVNRTTGARSVAVISRMGELRNIGDQIVGIIAESDLTLASQLECFASGKFGWAINGHGQSKVWVKAKLNQEGDRYASANALIEAMANTTKLRVLTGTAVGDCIPMPAGCSQAIVIKTMNKWDNAVTPSNPTVIVAGVDVIDTSNSLSDISTKAWWRDGDSASNNLTTEPYMLASTDPLWRMLLSLVNSVDGGGVIDTTYATVRYMVIGIPNIITANVT